jgi:predicted dehydrogenase
MNKIRVGLVGVGNWGRYGHLPALQLLPEYQITAISSRREDNAVEMARQFGAAHAFGDADQLIKHPDVDLVVVLPPAPHHAELVRAAIAAGKDVYCEWPLTTKLADSEDLLVRAGTTGVRHFIGLQRRVGPSARYVRDLLADGYVGTVRSVRMHVSMEYFSEFRSADLAWTIDPANFSHVLSIYGGHFFDLLFHVAGAPDRISAIVQSQFPTLTLTSTGEVFPNRTPDQAVVIGTLKNGAVLSVQIEGGKRNNSGLQIDITGTTGDLKISNDKSFGNAEDNTIEGAQGDVGVLRPLPVPASYRFVPPSTLDTSVLDLAHLYAAHARDRARGTHLTPDFADAVRMHRFIDRVILGSVTGTMQTVDDIWT